MMTSGDGTCLKTVLFESVLMLVIWFDVNGFVRMCFEARYLCSCSCSEPCKQINKVKKGYPNEN